MGGVLNGSREAIALHITRHNLQLTCDTMLCSIVAVKLGGAEIDGSCEHWKLLDVRYEILAS